MKSFLYLFLSIVIFQNLYSQELTKIAVIKENNYELVDAENQSGIIYISINDLTKTLQIKLTTRENGNKIVLDLGDYTIHFTNNIPFITIIDVKNKSSLSRQILNLPYQKGENTFISLSAILDLLNEYWDKGISQIAPNRIKIIETKKEPTPQQLNDVNNILNISLKNESDKSVIKINSTGAIRYFYNFYRNKNLHLILWNVSLSKDSLIFPSNKGLIEKVDLKKEEEFTEIIFTLSEAETITEILSNDENEFTIRISEREFGDWYTRESENFQIIYRDSHSHLISHILLSAENSLKFLATIFNYTPTEKIIINTYDVSDYGFGATTTVPENYIRLEIEPFEPGYEILPYNERFQWLLSHELVHIVVNDMENNFESGLRSMFGKVAPDKNQPLTVFFSLLTNNNRYTPRWYQEAMAVFIETWLSGGFGRVLGSYDEMYFRMMAYEGNDLPMESELEQVTSHKSIFLESLLYIYGARFIAHISNQNGINKLLQWYNLEPSRFYEGFIGRFEEIYNISLSEAWENFIKAENIHQQNNIAALKQAPITPLKKGTEKAFGWTTQPYYDKSSRSFYLGYHREGELATIHRFNLQNLKSEEIVTLPSPSMVQVASLAYDEEYKLIFYTTNNNLLYRDVWLYDLKINSNKCIFPNIRVGHLTISPVTHELFGIQHASGKPILVKSKYPYTEIKSLVVFNVGEEILQLAINRKGNLLAAVMHESNGQQSIILSDITQIDKGKPFIYKLISASGSPENVSWSEDGKFIYWNAYTNGVSNIYRYDLETGEIIPLTNTIVGLFRPVEISKDSMFAFEYNSAGFVPVIFENKKAEKLPAINYLGQNIIEKYPEVIDWNLKPANEVISKEIIQPEKTYYGLKNLTVKTFIPVITGFQSRKVLGLFFHANDPVMVHDFVIETGISPFKETTNDVKFHLRLKYSLNQKYFFSVDHNAPDFFDLFNTRKRGMLGSKYTLGYSDYWLYDNPLKIKQNTELTLYQGIKFINDNLTEVRQPDFAIIKSEFDYRYLRKTIGSIDWEVGNQFRVTALGYVSNPNDPEYSGQLFGEWDNYNLFLFDHNVIHLKFAAGYHLVNDNLPETKFFFGGFGNREIENEPVKQFEKVFRFPGVPIYNILSDRFFKFMIENSFPPIRIPNVALGPIELKNINISVFSQSLLTDSPDTNKWIDAGAQINIMLEHWFNLESTFSAGIAKAWWRNGNDTEWFFSWKLLKD